MILIPILSNFQFRTLAINSKVCVEELGWHPLRVWFSICRPNSLALFVLELDVLALEEIEAPRVVFRQDIADRVPVTTLEEVLRHG